jgi:beta-phosphoglucomutase family hydrolase
MVTSSSGSLSSPAFAAVILDMDGVVTRTARVHARAWKDVFDDFLRRHADETGTPFSPFDADSDYRAYVDGKPREEGVRGFLAARGTELPEGDPDDPAGTPSVRGLAKRKDELFQRHLREQGIELFESTIVLIEELRAAGVRIGIVTSSRNGREILARSGIEKLFDARIDGIDAHERGLRGKPDPDTFLACAATLGVSPDRAVILEDAVAGVAAGRDGGFGLVIGVDRGGNRQGLEANGADVVVADLAAMDLVGLNRHFIAAMARH